MMENNNFSFLVLHSVFCVSEDKFDYFCPFLYFADLKYYTFAKVQNFVLFDKDVRTLVLNISSIYTHFNTLKKNALRKHCGKR